MTTPELEKAVRNSIPEADSLELIDSVPIPPKGDRMARLRVIEEALSDFDRFENDRTRTYLVQLRPRSAPSDQAGTPTYAKSGAGLIDQMMEETFASPTPPAPPNQVRFSPAEPLYHPDGKLNADYLFKNAEVLYKAGEYQLARNILKTVLKAHERPAQTLLWIGKTFEAEGRFDEALKTYEQSLTFQPTVEAYQKTAAILQRQKKYAGAAETLERALQLKDLSPTLRLEIFKALGSSWAKAERDDRALDALTKAQQLDSRSEWILNQIGQAYYRLKKPREACDSYRAVLALNPRSAQAHADLGLALLELGEKRAAHDAFAKSLEIEVQNPSIIYQIVKCAYELRSYATAARLLERYADTGPVNAHLLYSLAGLQFHLGRMDDASETLRKILEIQPDHRGAVELRELIEKYVPAQP
jgi:tetratricopeptide (TPR) repeat protein